jgi:hypothetical protein
LVLTLMLRGGRGIWVREGKTIRELGSLSAVSLPRTSDS